MTNTPAWLTTEHFPESSVLDYYAELFERAVAGDWRAQLEVGIRYAEGEVFPARFDEGGRWIAIAAESGEADALNAYAHWLCESGDARRGLALLEQLTRDGDAFAPRNLADRCDDPDEAHRLRDLAIERGNTAAMLELVDELAADDMPAALALCRRAAALGDSDAAHLLGEAYERGLGVQIDARASLRWHRRAVALSKTAPGFGETR